MTASVLQERQSSSSAGGSTVVLAFASAVTAGSAIHALANAGSSGASYTFSDNNSGAYTTRDTVADTGSGQSLAHGTAVNHAAGATTVTVSFGSGPLFTGIWIREIGGVSTTALDGHNGGDHPGVTSASVSATNATQPALISSLCLAPNGPHTPSATTGTQDITGWDWGGGTNAGCSSHQRVTSAASQTSSFSVGATDNLLLVTAIFDEAGGGGASGSAAITEGADTVTASGSVGVSGSAALTEGTDTVAASGAVGVSGSAAITEGGDTVSASGTAGASGSAGITEGADAVSASGSVGVLGSAAITEAADTVSATGSVGVSGSAAITEGADTVSGTGDAETGATGAAAIAEGADTASGTGSVGVTGSASPTEDPDQVSGSGSVPQIIVTSADAGRARRRVRDIYRVTIDGQTFELRSFQAALDLLAQAKALALREAQQAIHQTLTAGRQKPLKLPQIEVNTRELRPIVTQTQREIQEVYAAANRDAEIALFLEITARTEHNDEVLMLLW